MFVNLVFISFINFVVCVELQYKIPEELCRTDTEANVQTITIGETENNTLPALLFVTDGKLWYSSDNIKWVQKPLPTGTTITSAFRRNFYNDNSECGKDIPLSFVVIISKGFKTPVRYNIYNPLNDTWSVPEVDGEWPLFDTHYLFNANNFTDFPILSEAFIWHNYILLYIGPVFITLELNQTNCDSTTDLSATVKTWGPANMNQMVHTFFHGDDLVAFLWLGIPAIMRYRLYQNSSINETGFIAAGPACCLKEMMTDLFGCDVISTPTTSIDILSTDSDSNETISETTVDFTESSDRQTNTSETIAADITSESIDSTSSTEYESSKSENSSNTSVGLIILLLVIALIVIAIIVAIVLWLKSSKKKDEEIAPVVDKIKPNVGKPYAKPVKEDSQKSVRSGLGL